MIVVRPKRPADDEQLARLWTERWGSPFVVSRGHKHDARSLPALVAEEDGALAGMLSFDQNGHEIEVVTLDSLSDNRGVGTALLEAMAVLGRNRRAQRLWLITTNDNIRAIRFYQRRGWTLCALHRDAIAESRPLKPEIPLIGDHGIPIRDEIEFELRL
jgi:ribosomal protein S18 acetylase RimI-like enzyme